MHPLLAAHDRPLLLMGNEAIIRGALEAGVGFVSTYPGTPSSEIGNEFFRMHAEAGVHFEFSTNEKVALETAAAAAAAGVRSLVAMKHVGVNVAADPLMTLSYVGVRGGFVLLTADDPGCHSSQNEQDNRHFARLGKMPMLEPATPADAYLLVREAFALSEKYETPVILRTTTRVAHTRGVVHVGALPTPRTRGVFTPDKRRFTPVPAIAKLRHPVVEKRQAEIEEEFNASPLNRQWGEGSFGIVTSGVAACYVTDTVQRLGIEARVRVLHLVASYPTPRRLLTEFVRQVDRVLIVEELDPLLENEVRAACVRAGKLIPIYGKESGHFSPLGELGPDQTAAALGQLLELESGEFRPTLPSNLPARPPILCPACPHRATYYAVKLAMGDEPLYLSDIGCYTLGFMPPIGLGDYFICMGSSASSGGGFAAVTDKPVVSFIGDSTFYHSGITGLINSVHNNRDLLLVVLDNSTTGMTGHQPHPGNALPGRPPVDLADIARAAGVEHVVSIDPLDTRASLEAIERLRAMPGVRVLISKSPCPIYARKTLRRPASETRYTVDPDKCRVCGREGMGLQCELHLHPHKDYALARGRARVKGGPRTSENYLARAPIKMQHPPCEAACPLGLCVQGYVQHIAAGRYREARMLIRQRLTMPHTVCRVCHHPCETMCIRGEADEPIAINRLKRFVMDRETDEDRAAYLTWLRDRIAAKDRRVAVIGAGPSGLSCAVDLRMRGYRVEVFEAEDEAGGMVRFGIPRYRLPLAALRKDLDFIRSLGIEIHYRQRLGREITLAGLKDKGFAAVYLAVGQPGPVRLGIEGEDLPGVGDALSFLREVNRGKAEPLSGEVMVVGGGNTAFDAARAALRLGATGVTVFYRRTRMEIPAIRDEIAAAEREGVRILELSEPMRIARTDGRISVHCRRTKMGDLDETGRRRPLPTGEEFDLVCDRLLIAIGQQSTLPTEGLGRVAFDRWGRLTADSRTGATGEPFVFAGGDAVSGAASVAEALQWGKYAAYGIDLALADDPQKVIVEPWRDIDELLREPRPAPVEPEKEARRRAPALPPEKAVTVFEEAEGVLAEAEARAEARRCLACGVCAVCNNCLENFGCPAFYQADGQIRIDPILCDGCGVCVQVCPNGAIMPLETNEAKS